MTSDLGPTEDLMQRIAGAIDRGLNGDDLSQPRRTGFVLLLFPLDGPEGARVNYVSNAKRGDILKTLQEITTRFEAQG